MGGFLLCTLRRLSPSDPRSSFASDKRGSWSRQAVGMNGVSQAAVPAPASRVWRQSWGGRICPLVSARSAGETPVGEWPPLSLNTHCPSRSTKRAGAWVTVLLVSCKPILLCTSNLTPHHFVPSPSTNSKTSQVVARAPWWPSG